MWLQKKIEGGLASPGIGNCELQERACAISTCTNRKRRRRFQLMEDLRIPSMARICVVIHNNVFFIHRGYCKRIHRAPRCFYDANYQKYILFMIPNWISIVSKRWIPSIRSCFYLPYKIRTGGTFESVRRREINHTFLCNPSWICERFV